MKDYILLNYNYLFNDHMAKCSNEAKLYYIKLMFFANNGFVANPIEILDSFGFDKSVLRELILNDEILVQSGRDEVFITAYFIHTKFNPMSWLSSPFATYWKRKLFVKPNGVATLKPQVEEKTVVDHVVEKVIPGDVMQLSMEEKRKIARVDWDDLLDSIDCPK